MASPFDLPLNLTQPPVPASRRYPFPSCPACLTIGLRRGWGIGEDTAQGKIEAFAHVDFKPAALVVTGDGFVATVDLDELRKEERG